ncbi:MAG: NUDIX domain-containing protein [Candidatus Hydrogenedentes bacterium]|nr:NUDIX domain-containing protein [Candidatus Hydrogenedentota bacterium]
MELSANVFEVWVFRRTQTGVEYLLLHTSQIKADRHFNGGRFWQIPGGFVEAHENIVGAIERRLAAFNLLPSSIWAAEHAYTIYNRRFDSMQIVGVYEAEADQDVITLDPEEHSDAQWFSFEECLTRVYYRGLKDGLRSVREYITGVVVPARELQLK